MLEYTHQPTAILTKEEVEWLEKFHPATMSGANDDLRLVDLEAAQRIFYNFGVTGKDTWDCKLIIELTVACMKIFSLYSACMAVDDELGKAKRLLKVSALAGLEVTQRLEEEKEKTEALSNENTSLKAKLMEKGTVPCVQS